MSPTILLRSGGYFDFTDPEGSPILIQDIAHALSHVCRFTGHTRHFYSVAQHSVLVSQIVPPQDAMAALLHDATEAYLGDVSRPLKSLLPDYKALEARVEAAIFKRFSLPATLPASVHHADAVLLLTEKRDLMPDSEPWPGFDGVEPLPMRIGCWDPAYARFKFYHRFAELRAKAVAA